MWSLADVKDAATVATSVIGAGALLFAALQYRSNQTWKKNEFLAKEMKDFLGDEKVKDAFRFFDYWGSSFSAKINEQDRTIYVFHTNEQIQELDAEFEADWVSLVSALNSNEGAKFTVEEQVVRDYIDHFFGYLERLCVFEKNKLFSEKEMMPFLRYQVATFNGLKEHSQGYHQELILYLSKYDYTLTLSLLKRFPKSPVVEETLGRIAASVPASSC
ncbi:hypothetical protein R1A27_28260 [Methylobacterium sp. NMS12]|uniref:hypothetical protein n=1 Tax=Methylobacterium sp. NMS12 TaxID=3079766 RepID=UPI003F882F72